jgi:diguanylate cyclase (GGDEF)-like protein/PAS domain S-box-containing protein
MQLPEDETYHFPDSSALFKLLPLGIVFQNARGEIEAANPAAQRILGLSLDQMCGRTSTDPRWRSIRADGSPFPGEQHPAMIALRTGQPVCDVIMGVFNPKAIGLTWININAIPIRGAETNDMRGVYAVFEDITARRSLENSLKKSEEQLRFVLEGSELGYWDWDIATGEVNRNERWATMLGYTPDEIGHSAQQWSDFVHPEDREKAWASIWEVIDGRSCKHELEYRMLHKDGSVRWILDQANVMERDADGKPIRMCGTHTDITERKILEEELRRQAQFDFLTKVCNRGYFMKQAEQELTRAKRYGSELSLLMLDIDFFKEINDRYGHERGDLVLQNLANICRHVFRQVDVIGRLGGEEFVILMPETPKAKAVEVAERLRTAVAGSKVPIEHGLPIQFTISIGVAEFNSKDDNIDVMLNAADKLLYAAKHAGRNRVCE